MILGGLFFEKNMSLLKNLQNISNKIISEWSHWSVPCELILDGKTYNVGCKYIRHHTKYDTGGEIRNAVHAGIEFHSIELKKEGVPFQNTKGKVVLAGAMVVVSDINAKRKYQIQSARADDTLGIIVCPLQLMDNNVTT